MTIATYATIVPLPPPVTGGTTIQSFTDPNGDVWVAKSGIRGGGWRRPRDVLRARLHRATNFNLGAAAWTPVQFDTITWDEYGLLTLNSNNVLTCPLAGMWQVNGGLNMTGMGSRLIAEVVKNGVEYARGVDVNASIIGSAAIDTVPLVVGDTIQFSGYSGTAQTLAAGGTYSIYVTVEYHGPPIGS
jgi:hypothetical protein